MSWIRLCRDWEGVLLPVVLIAHTSLEMVIYVCQALSRHVLHLTEMEIFWRGAPICKAVRKAQQKTWIYLSSDVFCRYKTIYTKWKPQICTLQIIIYTQVNRWNACISLLIFLCVMITLKYTWFHGVWGAWCFSSLFKVSHKKFSIFWSLSSFSWV